MNPAAGSAGAPDVSGHLGLGSNVGDARGHLKAAIEAMPGAAIEVVAISPVYTSQPVGDVLDQPDFLNAAVSIRTALDPEALLDACKGLERDRGRDLNAPRHSPRPLDIDILMLGAAEVAIGRLTVPHPELCNRRFVLVPLLDLDPELTLPDGTRLAACLEQLDPAGQPLSPAGAL